MFLNKMKLTNLCPLSTPQFPVSTFKHKGEVVHSSLQGLFLLSRLCLSQTLQGPLRCLTPSNVSLAVAGMEGSQARELGFASPKPGQVLIKLRQSRTKASLLWLKYETLVLPQREDP